MANKARHSRDVFLNCPFDEQYTPMFQAIVFTLLQCGMTPRCALEGQDSGEVRIDKICRLIEVCRYGLHDISRTEPDAASKLPRFNMPFELGMFLGAKRLGGALHREKACLILDTEPYRYQQFISDIAGQDIKAHRDEPKAAASLVRNWLNTLFPGEALPGDQLIRRRYDSFMLALPLIAQHMDLRHQSLEYLDFVKLATLWLRDSTMDINHGRKAK